MKAEARNQAEKADAEATRQLEAEAEKIRIKREQESIEIAKKKAEAMHPLRSTIEEYLKLDPRKIGKIGNKVTEAHIKMFNALKPISCSTLEHWWKMVDKGDEIHYDGATFEDYEEAWASGKTMMLDGEE